VTFDAAIGLYKPKGGCDLFYCLSSLKPKFDGVSRAAKNICPLANAFCCAIKRKKSCCSQIVGLLRWCSPSAISRFVVAIVVYAIQRAALWPRPHIFVKSLKRIFPLLANGYAASSPQIVPITVGVQASIFHGGPRFVLHRAAHSMSFRCFTRLLFLVASARNGRATKQLARSDKSLTTTVAHAKPARDWSSVCIYGAFAFCLNKKLAKLFAC
jgi:hypothetical protein